MIRSKIIPASIAGIMFLSLAPIALANNEARIGLPEKPLKAIEASKAALRSIKENEMKDRTASYTAKIKEDALNQIKNHWQVAKARLQEAIDRQANILERLQSATKKAKDQGTDVSQAEKALADATTKLAQARTTLAALDAKVTALASASTPQEKRAIVQDINTQTKALKKLLIEVHQQLQSIIPVIKRTLPKAATGSGEVKP